MQFVIRLKEFLRDSRLQLEADLGTDRKRRFFSPGYYSQYAVTLPLMERYAHGCLIDVGCGSMPFRQFIDRQLIKYDSLEFFPTDIAVTFVGDIQNMHMIADNTYDTAICLEVLEHVPQPFRAIDEICRILKPNGTFVVSVPNLQRLHMEPYDYFRYTRHGLRHMLENGGFRIIVLEKRGGLFSFIGNQVATLVLSLFWRVPVMNGIVWFINSWVVTRWSYWLDAILDPSGVYAIGYTAVASKIGS